MMKKILVPTDFSTFSDIAIESALKIAAKYGSDLILMHSIEQRSKDIRSEESAVLSKLRSQLAQFERHGIEVKYMVRNGRLFNAIQDLILEEGIDFVVIGSHGASGKKEYFLGSNTQKVIRSVHVPVLTVKNSFDINKLEKVLFASGFNVNDQDAFQRLLNFLRPQTPELHLLAINTSSFFAQPSLIVHEAMKDFEKLAEGFPIRKRFYNDISIEAGIRHFSEDLDIDLIAISNHDRHPVKRMFQGSNVEMLVNHSQIPVLTIDY